MIKLDRIGNVDFDIKRIESLKLREESEVYLLTINFQSGITIDYLCDNWKEASEKRKAILDRWKET